MFYKNRTLKLNNNIQYTVKLDVTLNRKKRTKTNLKNVLDSFRIENIRT